MNKKELEIFLTEEEKQVKKEEEEKKERIVMDKEFITESGKILLKD